MCAHQITCCHHHFSVSYIYHAFRSLQQLAGTSDHPVSFVVVHVDFIHATANSLFVI
jgi:hypothetical protein